MVSNKWRESMYWVVWHITVRYCVVSDKDSSWNLAAEWICSSQLVPFLWHQVYHQSSSESSQRSQWWNLQQLAHTPETEINRFQSCLWNTLECAICNLKTERKRILIWIGKGVQIWATSPFIAGSANTATCWKEYSLLCKQFIYL